MADTTESVEPAHIDLDLGYSQGMQGSFGVSSETWVDFRGERSPKKGGLSFTGVKCEQP